MFYVHHINIKTSAITYNQKQALKTEYIPSLKAKELVSYMTLKLTL